MRPLAGLIVLLLGGCPHDTSVDPAVPAVPAAANAPTPYTADAIRAAMPVGSVLVMRRIYYDVGPINVRWTVIDATETTVTMEVVQMNGFTGVSLWDPATDIETWADLRDIGLFPAEFTVITDATVEVPAGKFATKRYTVTDPIGKSVSTYDFDVARAGPPISIAVDQDGDEGVKRALTMLLLSRI